LGDLPGYGSKSGKQWTISIIFFCFACTSMAMNLGSPNFDDPKGLWNLGPQIYQSKDTQRIPKGY
jgi:hypothetical protein